MVICFGSAGISLVRAGIRSDFAGISLVRAGIRSGSAGISLVRAGICFGFAGIRPDFADILLVRVGTSCVSDSSTPLSMITVSKLPLSASLNLHIYFSSIINYSAMLQFLTKHFQ